MIASRPGPGAPGHGSGMCRRLASSCEVALLSALQETPQVPRPGAAGPAGLGGLPAMRSPRAAWAGAAG